MSRHLLRRKGARSPGLRISALLISCVFLNGCQLTHYLPFSELEPVTPEQIPRTKGIQKYTLSQPAPYQQPEQQTLTPQQQADLWERVRLQLSIQVPNLEVIEDHKQWYLRNPSYIPRVTQRAAPLMYFIVDEIEKRGLPLELAFVPIVESAFDTFAYSHGRASGLWQFIPSTALHYGLDINWWYDGRRDVVAATHTALDYFARLHDTFDGDWLLAIAAYNGGQGRVANAIRRNEAQGLPTDFWNLSLPRETRNYVPKILALSSLLAERHRGELAWRFTPNQPVLEIVDVGQQMDLALAASMAGMEVNELHRFNSGYNRWATAPDGPYHLLMPQAAAESFQRAIEGSDRTQWVEWARHRVRSGESLNVIARAYNTTPGAIQRANNISGSLIRSGDYLLIPVASEAAEVYQLASDQRREQRQNEQRGDRRIDHEVQSGDSLWEISREHGVGVNELARWNNMAPGDTIRLGQELVIWVDSDSNTEGTSSASLTLPEGIQRTVEYRVRRGDSLARIANRFRVTISDIERWNQISRDRYLQPGETLKLHVVVTQGG